MRPAGRRDRVVEQVLNALLCLALQIWRKALEVFFETVRVCNLKTTLH